MWKSLVTLTREALVKSKGWKSDWSRLKREWEVWRQSSDCRQQLPGSLWQRDLEKCSGYGESYIGPFVFIIFC